MAGRLDSACTCLDMYTWWQFSVAVTLVIGVRRISSVLKFLKWESGSFWAVHLHKMLPVSGKMGRYCGWYVVHKWFPVASRV
jgi:hypothetical protein